ncbi:hypothetical protein QF047_002380 [Arthrobacter sp. W4I7]|nr:hypothetical protein [Arthrobacter sp. W4I7]
MRPVLIGPALVQIAMQQLRTTGIAELMNLVQQLRDRRPGLFGSPTSQIIAVGFRARRPVLRNTSKAFWLARGRSA